MPAALPPEVSRVIELIRGEPLAVAIVVAVVGLAAIALVALLLRRRSRTHGSKFRRVLAKQDAVTVLLHPNPDPDAMASALGVAHLGSMVDTTTDICYSGRIAHQENRAFRTVLDVDFERIEAATDLPNTPVVLVDHNEARGFQGCEGIRPIAVVDHHPGDGYGSNFTDVREEYGACATIIAEYFQGLGATPGEQGLPSGVATGLLYGILADTSHLTRGASRADFDAAAYLSPGVDSDALDRIANPPVDADVLDTVATAISERDVRGPFAVSDVGEITNPDSVPQAADELLQLEGITAVVVFGSNGEELYLSGRSRDDRVHMGDALSMAVDEIAMSEAGGHARMGGGRVSVPHLEGLRPDSGITRDVFKDRLFDAMAGDVT